MYKFNSTQPFLLMDQTEKKIFESLNSFEKNYLMLQVLHFSTLKTGLTFLSQYMLVALKLMLISTSLPK